MKTKIKYNGKTKSVILMGTPTKEDEEAFVDVVSLVNTNKLELTLPRDNQKGSIIFIDYNGSTQCTFSFNTVSETINRLFHQLQDELKEIKKSNLDFDYFKRLSKIQKELILANVDDLFGTSKEVYSLPELLNGDEKIIYATSGMVDKGTVLVVITDQRLIYVNRGMIYGTDFREIPFSKINAVSYSSGIALAKIMIDNGANTTVIENVFKHNAPIFVERLKSIIAEKENARSNKDIADSTSISVADELLKLAKLKNEDVITEEEFKILKSKLINN